MLALGIVGLVLLVIGVSDLRHLWILETVGGVECSSDRFMYSLAVFVCGVVCITTGFNGNPWSGFFFGLCALLFAGNASLVYATIYQDPEEMNHLSMSAALLALVAVLSIVASFVF